MGFDAELPREREHAGRVVHAHAQEDGAPGSVPCQLVQLGFRIEGVPPDTERVRRGHVRRRLHRVRVEDVPWVDADRRQELELSHRGDLEARAGRRERLEDLGRRVALDGVEALDAGERRRETAVPVAHGVQVADEERCRLVDTRERAWSEWVGPGCGDVDAGLCFNARQGHPFLRSVAAARIGAALSASARTRRAVTLG
jgi:hypothetical protein